MTKYNEPKTGLKAPKGDDGPKGSDDVSNGSVQTLKDAEKPEGMRKADTVADPGVAHRRHQTSEARQNLLLELALSHHSEDRAAEIRQRWDEAGKSGE